jgi:predicted GNAT superfamily acetyltransferase
VSGTTSGGRTLSDAERIVIRDLEGMDEYRAAFVFQDEIWGPGFTEGVPASLQKVAQWVGGVAAGAFDGDELVGFAFGITGPRNGELVHWSDILAVRSGIRDGGIGRRLKWHQRERAMAAGAREMQWTWDPLEARNGWLNLERLGAYADTYIEEMYGSSTSPLHVGVGTDRLVARWVLDDPRVEAASEQGVPPARRWPASEPVIAFDPEGDAAPDPAALRPPRPGHEYRVPVPSDLQTLKSAEPEAARMWRAATRAALRAAMHPKEGGAWFVAGMHRTRDGASAYRLLPNVF